MLPEHKDWPCVGATPVYIKCAECLWQAGDKVSVGQVFWGCPVGIAEAGTGCESWGFLLQCHLGGTPGAELVVLCCSHFVKQMKWGQVQVMAAFGKWLELMWARGLGCCAGLLWQTDQYAWTMLLPTL